ncbi:MAG: IS630 family transposase [Bradymonadia bacterium]
MARPARRIELTAECRRDLEAVAWSESEPYRAVVRARMILWAAGGATNEAIAQMLRVTPQAVCKWRRRFAADPRLVSLRDVQRSGRPARVPLSARCEVIKLACERPDGKATPFREVWTQQALATAVAERTGVSFSRSEVRRILHAEGLRPHTVRQWLHSQDPDFATKVKAVCDLYMAPADERVVVCVDEKPMQVLARLHPTHRDIRGSVRYEYEYKRGGTRSLLGAFDIRSGLVMGHVVEKRSGDALVAFMEDLARVYPDREVVVVWDNLNIHYDGADERWTRFNAAHGGRFRFVYTPLHASWMNQVEVWFSILQRRVLRYGSFANAAELEAAVLGFIGYWNRCEAHPFNWKFRGEFAHTRGQRRPRGKAPWPNSSQNDTTPAPHSTSCMAAV